MCVCGARLQACRVDIRVAVSFRIESAKVPLRILLALAAAWTAFAQIPRFEDYPVTETFKGTPAAPILATPQERLYSARIREGVSKGLGVMRDGIEKPGPNFAGHYIVVSWLCGLPCELNAIVDAVTGRIYGPPLSEGLALPVIMRGGADKPGGTGNRKIPPEQ
jgi:hypothetical protein